MRGHCVLTPTSACIAALFWCTLDAAVVRSAPLPIPNNTHFACLARPTQLAPGRPKTSARASLLIILVTLGVCLLLASFSFCCYLLVSAVTNKKRKNYWKQAVSYFHPSFLKIRRIPASPIRKALVFYNIDEECSPKVCVGRFGER
jgi:hypothetical protein